MVKTLWKYLEQTSVADGSPFSLKWTADRDYVVKHILFLRKDGASYTKSEVTITIADVPWTRDKILIASLGNDIMNAWPVNEELKDDEEVKLEGYNREGVTLDIVCQLFLEIK